MTMCDVREQWYDAAAKVAVTFVDVTSAAQALAQGHLAGPVASHYLTEALAAAALLGAETELPDEVVSVQMKCDGPLGGYNVECTTAGTLRGYTEKKTLDAFDGMGRPDDGKVVGSRQIQVTRSIPGKILAQGLAQSFDGYLADSLQRKARMFLEAAVDDEVRVREARGLLVEAMPDSTWALEDGVAFLDGKSSRQSGRLAVAPRNVLAKLGFAKAELKSSTPLSFACRCSPERAAAMLAAVPKAERRTMPETIDVTCHMCGKIFTVRTMDPS